MRTGTALETAIVAVAETTTATTDTVAKDAAPPAASVAPPNQTLTKQTAAKPKPTANAPIAKSAASHPVAINVKTAIANEIVTGSATANGTASVDVTAKNVIVIVNAIGTTNAAHGLLATTIANVATVKTNVSDSTAPAGTRAAAATSSITVVTRPVQTSDDADVTATRRVWPADLRSGIGGILVVSVNVVGAQGGIGTGGSGLLPIQLVVLPLPLPLPLPLVLLRMLRRWMTRLFILEAKRGRLKRKSSLVVALRFVG